MATIENRTRKDGTTAYRLKWRFGGKRDGAQQSITYAEHDDAKCMTGAIEAPRHHVYDTDPLVITFELVTGQKPTAYTAPTFGEVAEKYVSTRTRAKVTTKELYRRTLRNRAGALLARPVESITDDDVKALLSGITDAGRSSKMIYDLLRGIFRYAVVKTSLAANPMNGVEPPKRRPRTVNFLSSRDAGLLLDGCRTLPHVGDALADVVDVILGTGLRISEALGLVAGDVHVDNVDRAWIDVEMQLSRTTSGSAESRRVSLKTEASHRRVALDSATARVLARLVDGLAPDAPVFPHPVAGGWWEHRVFGKAFERARTAARRNGMAKTPRVHDLRHTHAAWLLTDGVPLLAVSRRLGHESIGITADIYGHLLPEGDDAIRAVLTNRRAALVAPVRRVHAVVPVDAVAA